MTMTIKRPRRMATLNLTGVAGVERAANGSQMSDDGEFIRGWQVIKSDGTAVERPFFAGTRTPGADVKTEFTTKADVMSEMERLAETVIENNPGVTKAEAVDAVYCARPDLVAAYRDAAYAPVERVERAAPAVLPGSEHVAEIDRLTREYAERTGKSTDTAMTAVLKSDRGVELTMLYRNANGWL